MCGGCPGYEMLKEVLAEVKEDELKEIEEMREETARLSAIYKPCTPDEQTPMALGAAAGNQLAKAMGQFRTKGGPDLYCRGCGRNNLRLTTRDDMCSRCAKRRRLGLPLETGIEIHRGIRISAKKEVGV